MASATGVTAEQTTTEVFPWLKTLPLAPEYHPTLAEFQDPIAYIFKIEKEASKYGICKIVPPVTAGPKKTAIANFNRSLAARSGTSNPNSPPTFTTRQQQIGFCPRKHRPVQKPVWQSGEKYTLPQFEAKAKSFEKTYLKKIPKKGLTALEIETLYWKANGDKPFSVEYANDMPGSAFVPVSLRKSKETGDNVTVGETAWNMRGVSRAKGSLLRFMKEEIPGVTSPMVYVAMLFSWFAWHVEDHDLHSLNYMHTGAGKTWYGVPRDAAVAFEEVIRVHGYGEEINPLVTFAILGEKTTVMSPEVIIGAGIPCCRLVQNAGEFVVTFPRAYHSGFSHGFNCGEAANIATPEWLRFAKDAAIRRASISCPPMVSHFQLLYDLALSLCSRIPRSIGSEPRSSRLKEKQKGEGEALIKELFVEDVMRNNELLNILGEGSSVVLLPQNSLDDAAYSNLRVAAQLKKYSRLSLEPFNPEKEMTASDSAFSENSIGKLGFQQLVGGSCPANGNFSSYSDGNRLSSGDDDVLKVEIGKERTTAAKLSDRGLFSCVTCGILSFACVALVQPSEAAAQYLMSADCRNFSGRDVGSGVVGDGFAAVASMTPNSPEQITRSGRTRRSCPAGLFDVAVQSTDQIETAERSPEMVFNEEAPEGPSALGLLALTYGNSSDSEEEEGGGDTPHGYSETRSRDISPDSRQFDDSQATSSRRVGFDDTGSPRLKRHREASSCDRNDSGDNVSGHFTNAYEDNGPPGSDFRDSGQIIEYSMEAEAVESTYVEGRYGNNMKLPVATLNSQVGQKAARNISSIANAASELETTSMLFAPRCNSDSSRLHVFCLQHAAEVRELLRPIGGALILLLCHPDYPEIEAEAKIVAEEQGTDYLWKDVSFRDAAEDDEERIHSAQESEDGGHGNGDWTVKLGINLYYSASLSRSPLYSKQMPYNSIIYKAFGRCSPTNSPLTKPVKVQGKGFGKQRKIAVAGKWCGKVWMSNQVHPLIANRDTEEGEMSLGFRTMPEARHERPTTPKTGGKKRKNVVETKEIITYQKRKASGALPRGKRLKVEESSDLASDHSEEEMYGSHNRRSLKNKKPRPDTPPRSKQAEMSSDTDMEGGSQNRRNLKNMKPRPETPPRSRQVEMSSDTDMEGGSQNRRNLKNKKPRPETPPRSKHVERSSDTDMEGGPSMRLRRRIRKPRKEFDPADSEPVAVRKAPKKKKATGKKAKKAPVACSKEKIVEEEEEHEEFEEEEAELEEVEQYQCDIEGCTMGFYSKQELVLHKRNICPVKGCGKKFFSHKYLVQHKRVHDDDRPLKCPWKGCKMAFKWAWARTEHIRVHTGARPYVCAHPDCGQTFRFVSDFSRHKRKTGHNPRKGKGLS